MKIFLIGFMGSGKTTSGKLLANRLAIPFIDMDEYISTKEGLSVAKIFDLRGERVFRKLEQKYLGEIIQLKQICVVATGGGTPCYFDNMHRMNEAGVTIYLQHEPGTLAHRLRNATECRPLLAQIAEKDIEEFIHGLLVKRIPYYLQCQYIADNETDPALEAIPLPDLS